MQEPDEEETEEYGRCPWCGEDELDFGIIGSNCNYCSYPDGDEPE